MRYTTIPNTDLKVSKICMGTMNWGQQNTEAEAHEQLDYAISQGVNFIDTAEIYPIPVDPEKQGTTERFVGSWLKKRGNRDSLVIASKIASSDLIRTRPIHGERTRYDRKNILAAIEGTLERLQTDHIDIYQLHWPERMPRIWGKRGTEELYDFPEFTPIEETLEAMAEIIRAGKVRYIGISNESPWGFMEFLRLAREKGLPRIVTIQNQYDLTNRTFEIGHSEICLREGVGLLPYSPLGGGTLSGKYLGGAQPADARHTLFPGNRERYNGAHVQGGIHAYVDVAKKHGLDPVQMALSFVNDRAFTTSTIIGTTSVEQARADIASIDLTLSPEVLADIAAVYKAMPDPHA
jgi:aryl-alcohol dehydrogenase-like predicted oxidoreductase